MRIFISSKPVLALKISKSGVGVYLGTACYGYALHCLFVYLVEQGTCPLFKNSKDYLFYLHASSKNEIQICSNKHETCLVLFFYFLILGYFSSDHQLIKADL